MRILLALTLSILGACANLQPEFDPPTVSVESVRGLPAQEEGPRFEIILRIANPNQLDLDIAGVSYTIELMGKKVVSGVTNEVPLIRGYTDETVTLVAGINTFQVIRLLASLGTKPTDSLEYRFSAKIDFNGFTPTQRVEEVGQISLQ